MTIHHLPVSQRPRLPLAPAAGQPRPAARKTATCRYCHLPLPPHVSLAAHYATCTVLEVCLGPKSAFPGHPRFSPAPPAPGRRPARHPG